MCSSKTLQNCTKGALGRSPSPGSSEFGFSWILLPPFLSQRAAFLQLLLLSRLIVSGNPVPSSVTRSFWFLLGFLIYLNARGFFCDEKHTLQRLRVLSPIHALLFSCNSSLSTNMGHVRKKWVSPEWILGKIPCCKSTSTAGNVFMLNTLLGNKIFHLGILLDVGIGTYFRSNYCQHFGKILRAFLYFSILHCLESNQLAMRHIWHGLGRCVFCFE